MSVLKKICAGVSAGLLIGVGGTVYLACENQYVGAALFTAALLCICLKGYSLYTGRIAFIPETHDKETVSELLLGLLGNLIGAVAGGYAILFAMPALSDKAYVLCAAKLAQSFPETLIRGVFCGILMYLAVSIYKEKQNIVGILFCIPVFILSGFEHSVADMFYFAVSGMVETEAFVFIWTVILGNTLGAMLLPALGMIKKKEKIN